MERGSTYALGVPTTLDSARVGVFSGQMGMTSLNVANPRNFSAPHFLKLKTGQIDVSLSSLRQDTVVIPLLELKGVDVNLEKKSGQSNYQVILDNLKKLESGQKPPETAQTGSKKKYVIRQVVIRDTIVHADLLGFGGSATKLDLALEPITLHNVGSDTKGGALFSEVADTLTKAILLAAMKKGQGILPADMINDLGSQLSGLTSLASQGVQVAGDLGKQINHFGTDPVGAATQMSKTLQDTSQQLQKGVEGLGNLFKKDQAPQ